MNTARAYHSESFEQPQPIRPFEITDAIMSLSKDAEHIALLEILIASMEVGTPLTAPSAAPPPTPRLKPIPLPDLYARVSKPEIGANPRPLPPIPPQHIRFRRALRQIPPDPSGLPLPGGVSFSQPRVLPNTSNFPIAPLSQAPPSEAVSHRLPSLSPTAILPTMVQFNVIGPACPVTNYTSITVHPHDNADALSMRNNNDSLQRSGKTRAVCLWANVTLSQAAFPRRLAVSQREPQPRVRGNR